MNIFLDPSRDPENIRSRFQDLYLNEIWEELRSLEELKGVVTLCGAPKILSVDKEHFYESVNWLLNYCQDKKIDLPLIILKH